MRSGLRPCSSPIAVHMILRICCVCRCVAWWHSEPYMHRPYSTDAIVVALSLCGPPASLIILLVKLSHHLRVLVFAPVVVQPEVFGDLCHLPVLSPCVSNLFFQPQYILFPSLSAMLSLRIARVHPRSALCGRITFYTECDIIHIVPRLAFLIAAMNVFRMLIVRAHPATNPWLPLCGNATAP